VYFPSYNYRSSSTLCASISLSALPLGRVMRTPIVGEREDCRVLRKLLLLRKGAIIG